MPPRALYLHIPFCRAKCDYCDFFSVPTVGVPDAYVDALTAEISTQQSASPLTSVYLGGGTPALLTPQQLTRILTTVRSRFALDDGAELTLEANPADITPAFLSAASDAGITRLSVGIQSYNDAALRAVHRLHQNVGAESPVGTAQRTGFRVSADMIAGLPEETSTTFAVGLQRLLDDAPQHVSLYTLTVEDGTPLARSIASGETRWNADAADDMWLAGRDLLEAAGYRQYEVSAFALPGYECRHSLSYWHQESYLGAGAGAVGTVYAADGSGVRVTRPRDIASYIGGAISDVSVEQLDFDTVVFEHLMLGFRTRAGISADAFAARFGITLADRIGAVAPDGVFRRWQQAGLAETAAGEGAAGLWYRLTASGLLFLNRFLTELLC